MEWIEKEDSLQKTYIFDDFKQAIQWMAKASIEIDKLNHHPEWYNIYNKVHVVLRTHDAGNTVTEKDRELALILDSIK